MLPEGQIAALANLDEKLAEAKEDGDWEAGGIVDSAILAELIIGRALVPDSQRLQTGLKNVVRWVLNGDRDGTGQKGTCEHVSIALRVHALELVLGLNTNPETVVDFAEARGLSRAAVYRAMGSLNERFGLRMRGAGKLDLPAKKPRRQVASGAVLCASGPRSASVETQNALAGLPDGGAGMVPDPEMFSAN